MTHSSNRHISIDADYKTPSVNRWTPEDDLAQKLYAPSPIDNQLKVDTLIADLCIGLLLVAVVTAVLFILLSH